MLEILAVVNIQVNQASNKGATPLFIACKKGRLDVVKTLLTVDGIQVNQASGGATPLYMASQKSFLWL